MDEALTDRQIRELRAAIFQRIAAVHLDPGLRNRALFDLIPRIPVHFLRDILGMPESLDLFRVIETSAFGAGDEQKGELIAQIRKNLSLWGGDPIEFGMVERLRQIPVESLSHLARVSEAHPRGTDVFLSVLMHQKTRHVNENIDSAFLEVYAVLYEAVAEVAHRGASYWQSLIPIAEELKRQPTGVWQQRIYASGRILSHQSQTAADFEERLPLAFGVSIESSRWLKVATLCENRALALLESMGPELPSLENCSITDPQIAEWVNAVGGPYSHERESLVRAGAFPWRVTDERAQKLVAGLAVLQGASPVGTGYDFPALEAVSRHLRDWVPEDLRVDAAIWLASLDTRNVTSILMVKPAGIEETSPQDLVVALSGKNIGARPIDLAAVSHFVKDVQIDPGELIRGVDNLWLHRGGFYQLPHEFVESASAQARSLALQYLMLAEHSWGAKRIEFVVRACSRPSLTPDPRPEELACVLDGIADTDFPAYAFTVGDYPVDSAVPLASAIAFVQSLPNEAGSKMNLLRVVGHMPEGWLRYRRDMTECWGSATEAIATGARAGVVAGVMFSSAKLGSFKAPTIAGEVLAMAADRPEEFAAMSTGEIDEIVRQIDRAKMQVNAAPVS